MARSLQERIEYENKRMAARYRTLESRKRDAGVLRPAFRICVQCGASYPPDVGYSDACSNTCRMRKEAGERPVTG